MKKGLIYLSLSTFLVLPIHTVIAASSSYALAASYTSTQETLKKITPKQALWQRNKLKF